MKIWHDDVRPAPDGWLWAATNAAAQELFAQYSIEAISLDHDLGAIPTGEMSPTEILYLKGSGEETGLDLVMWMIEQDCVPASVTIHSWNPAGAKRMAQGLDDAGYHCLLEPFVMP